jgi:DNA-binding protein
MKGFEGFLIEAKNTHMTHIEELVIDGGVSGTRDSINYLRSLRDMLAGSSRAKINATVKWDGAPAIFAGIDPTDGRFFVAKKGIFNKNPKVYKTPQEILADTSGDLAEKLKVCLEHLPKIGIKGVIQGDLMFTSSDLKTAVIDGEKMLTFHPNTILYAVPVKSALARSMKTAKLGIIWHTQYEGSTFETMKSKFAGDIKKTLKQSKDVWFDDATYRDVSGTATMTAKETSLVTNSLSKAGKIFNSTPAALLNEISDNDQLNMLIKTFNNNKIRAGGSLISNADSHVVELFNWITDRFAKEVESKKTEKGKETTREKQKEVLSFFTRYSRKDIAKVFAIMKHIIEAKHYIINKMNNASGIGTFLRTANGFVVTKQEGFVAIDRTGSNAVKLVDRLEFSRANFSTEYIKGWQR